MNRFVQTILLLLIITILVGGHAEFAMGQCPHQLPGLKLFSTLANWNKVNSTITISQNTLLDKSPGVLLNGIIVQQNASLIFNNVNLNLTLNFIRVDKGGKLIAGNSSCPITGKIVVTFYGNRTTSNLIGSDPLDGSSGGAKGLAAMSGSFIQIVGSVDGLSWVELAESVIKGTNIIKTRSSTNWKVGDSILLTTTDYGELLDKTKVTLPTWRVGVPFPDQNEERTIVSIINSTTFLVNQALSFTHYASGSTRGEVAKLNRNIVFEGDVSSESSSFGGHVIIRLVEQFEMVGVEFRRMGQKGLMGRYAIHFHLLGDKALNSTVKPFILRDNSIYNSYQRCITVHDSNYIQIENNVCYNINGHAFFLENGSEMYNLFKNNLGAKVLPVINSDPLQIIPSDNDVSVFWITNTMNYFEGNRAVGGKFGYWFSLPEYAIGLVQDKYANSTIVRPRMLPLGSFKNNVVHSSNHVGLHIDDFVDVNGFPENDTWVPIEPPYPVRGSKGRPIVESIIENFVAFKIRKWALWLRAGSITLRNMVVADSRIGIDIAGEPSVVEDSVFEAESGNVGETYRAGIDVSRSYPGFFSNTEEFKAYEFYDNGGPSYVRNTVFRNYKSNAYRKAGAITNLSNANFKYETGGRVRNLTFVNSNDAFYLEAPTDGNRGMTVLDTDGSMTGFTGGGWSVSNNSFLTIPGCIAQPDWNSFNCPTFKEGYGALTLVNYAGFSTSSPLGSDANLNKLSVKMTRLFIHDTSNPGKYDQVHGWNMGTRGFWMDSNLALKNVYVLRWALNIGTPIDLQYYLRSIANNDWIVLAVQYPRSAVLDIRYETASLSQRALPRVNSIDDLMVNPNSYFYENQTEHLFLHFKNTAGRTSFAEYYNEYAQFTGYSTKFSITATCPNNNCQVYNWDFPTATIDKIKKITLEERFSGVLQPCQVSSGMSNAGGNGKVLAGLLPNKRTVDFTVYHDLSHIATQIQVGIGKVGEIVRYLQEPSIYPTPYSVSRFSMDFSYDEIISLLKGEVFVLLKTSTYPNGHLRAQIYCNNGVTQFGTPRCSLPVSISAAQPCGTISADDMFKFYSESTDISTQTGWVLQTVTKLDVPVAQKDYSTAPICGSTSIRFGMGMGKVQITKSYTKGGPVQFIDLSKFRYFEFFIKSVTEGQLNLNIFFSEIKNTAFSDIPAIYIDSKYIQHFKIDHTRVTRVRIPVSDIPFTNQTGLNSVQRVTFMQKPVDDITLDYREFIMDDVRFITESYAQMTDVNMTSSPILPSDISGFRSVCGNSVSDPDVDAFNQRVYEPPYCSQSCNGNGNCTAPFTCQCNQGWTGETCNTPICSLNCTDRGQCISPETCLCNSGYGATQCSLPICYGKVDSGLVCSGVGNCTSPDSCACPLGRVGNECESTEFVCFGYGASNPLVCSKHGTCIADGKCSCNEGWRGSKCATKV